MISDEQLARYPTVERLLDEVEKKYGIFSKARAYLVSNFDGQWLDNAENIFAHLFAGREDRLAKAAQSFIKYSHEYLYKPK